MINDKSLILGWSNPLSKLSMYIVCMVVFKTVLLAVFAAVVVFSEER